MFYLYALIGFCVGMVVGLILARVFDPRFDKIQNTITEEIQKLKGKG